MFKIRNILISLGLIIIAILVYFPIFLKNYITDNSKEIVGRTMKISDLSYNYFSNTIKMQNFKMYESNDVDVFTSLDVLNVNFNPLQLLKNKIDIEHVYINGLSSKIIMKDSIFNFSDLLEAEPEQKDTINTDTTENYTFNISNIQLKNSTLSFDDKITATKTEFQDIFIKIPNISSGQKIKSNAIINFDLKNGGDVQSSFDINFYNGNFDGLMTIKEVTLKPFYNYITDYALINKIEGSLNAELKLEGTIYELSKSVVKGIATADDFEMTDTEDKTFMSAKNIHTEFQFIDYWNNQYDFSSITIKEPYTFFQLDSLSNNFSRIFKLDVVEKETLTQSVKVISDTITESTTEIPLNYTIDKLILNDGTLDYTDNLTGQNFKYNLSDIQINTDSITNTSKWLEVHATMLLNKRGSLKSRLGIDPNNYLNSSLNFSVDNFLLSDLNIYINHYMGHSVLKGDMYYTSKSKLVDGKIKSNNHLLVKHATLENTKGGLYNLPLKFAFFLLTDKHGDINLDIPVKGDLNDPSIDIRSIVWKTFKNVINKTIAKPINFLVNLVGGDPKELKELNFEYTDSILSETHKKQLSKLSNLERKKNELKITMTYYVDTPLLTKSITTEQIGLQFYKETGENYLKEEKDFFAYVQNKVDNDSLSLEIAIGQLTKGISIDSLVNTRKKNTLRKVKRYLKREYPATNIILKEGKPEDPENSGAYPKFLITYDLAEQK